MGPVFLDNLLSSIKGSLGVARRNLQLRKFAQRNYNSFDEYLAKTNYDTELSTVWFNGTPLDFLFQFNSFSKPLLVFFHGAVDQEKTVVPHFVGTSYKNILPANLLHIADSSLVYDKSIRAGWYLGCRNIPLQQVIKEIVLSIAKYIGSSKIIFFGSSGGGFPALYLSQVVPGSLAIVNSPATSILHHPHRSSRVSQYLKFSFGTESFRDEERVLREVVISDLREGFEVNKGSVLYLLNINDSGNITSHSEPFMRQFSSKMVLTERKTQRIGNMCVLTDDWGAGHRYPPAPLLRDIFLHAIAQSTSWSNDCFDKGLQQICFG